MLTIGGCNRTLAGGGTQFWSKNSRQPRVSQRKCKEGVRCRLCQNGTVVNDHLCDMHDHAIGMDLNGVERSVHETTVDDNDTAMNHTATEMDHYDENMNSYFTDMNVHRGPGARPVAM